MSKSYLIAANEVEHEIIVNRSRFICFLAPCTSTDQAKTIVKALQQQHPNASHYCYAYLSAAADDSRHYGFSDDGEPSGTAGKPILASLQGGGIGEVCAVVVRYFGGTKLGTGGLQRAYGASVREALAFLRSETKIPMVHKGLACQYSQVDTVLHLLTQAGGEVIEQDYSEQITMTLSLPSANLEQFSAALKTASAGQLALVKL